MLWNISRILFTSADLITQTFLAFFIWETNNDLNTILIFSLMVFLAIPLATLISTYIGDVIDPKFSILIGNWVQIIQLIVLLTFAERLTIDKIIAVGLIGGLSQGFRKPAIVLRREESPNHLDTEKFYASRIFISTVLKLIIPLSAAYFINQTDSYDILFKIVIIILVITSFTSIFLRSHHTSNAFNLKEIFTIPGTNPDKLVLVKGIFFEGLSEGITITILPIIILSLAGSVLNWGFINTGLVIFSILISLIISKTITDLRSRVIYSIGAFIFAASSIFFMTQFNFYLVIVFLIAMTLMDLIKEISYNSALGRIVEEDIKSKDLHAEYHFLTELVTAIGRSIPVLILLYLGLNIQDEVIIRFTLLAVGILPLIVVSFLGQSAVFKEDPINKNRPEEENLGQSLPSLDA